MPAASFIAALATAGYLSAPLTVAALGTRTPWFLPLALGVALGAARAPLGRRLRARLKPQLFAAAAERALSQSRGVPEARAEEMFWTVWLLERAVLVTGPVALASLAAVVVTLLVIAGLVGATLAVPVGLSLAVALAARARLNARLVPLLQAQYDARTALAARVAAALRDPGEVRAPRARAHFRARTVEVTAALCAAESNLERTARAQRAGVMAGFVALAVALLWAIAGVHPRALLAGVPAHAPFAVVRALALLLTALPAALALSGALDELHATREQLRAVGRVEGAATPAPTAAFPAGARVLSLDRATVRYGDHVALREVSVEIPLTGATAIVGPNGAGKTTLARLCAGITAASSGGASVAGVPTGQIVASALALVPQDPVLIESLSVRENLRLVAPDADDAALRAALARVGLDLDLARATQALSRGEQRRIALARALACDPRVLVLDEPDAWLDSAGRRALRTVVREESLHRAVLVVSHRAELVRAADRVIVLAADHTLEDAGPPAEVAARSVTLRRILDAELADEPVG